VVLLFRQQADRWTPNSLDKSFMLTVRFNKLLAYNWNVPSVKFLQEVSMDHQERKLTSPWSCRRYKSIRRNLPSRALS
jgi:hypothetical protein